MKPPSKLNLVIGYPLKHSQSPLLHNTLYQLFNIKKVMLALACPELKPLIHIIKKLTIELTAVTMPFKQDIFHYLDDCSPEVERLKTTNTVILKNGKLFGYNTDLAGIAFALKNIELHGKQVLVMGAGGAARALGYFLAIKQANILWSNRTLDKASLLADEFGGDIILSEKINTICPDIIINTTPIGLYPHVSESLLSNFIFNEKQTVFDMVYHPALTQLLKNAHAKQAHIISGLEMFIGQGLKQIELFSERNIDDKSIIDNIKNILIQHQTA